MFSDVAGQIDIQYKWENRKFVNGMGEMGEGDQLQVHVLSLLSDISIQLSIIMMAHWSSTNNSSTYWYSVGEQKLEKLRKYEFHPSILKAVQNSEMSNSKSPWTRPMAHEK